jgi:hypothetical protein
MSSINKGVAPKFVLQLDSESDDNNPFFRESLTFISEKQIGMNFCLFFFDVLFSIKGHGAFGSVFAAKLREGENTKVVAVKKLIQDKTYKVSICLTEN